MNETLTTSAPLAPPAVEAVPPRLTSMSHGGGGGCKIAPGVLREILVHAAPGFVPPALLAGIGFGLAGHLLEVCRASNVSADVDWSSVPLHPDVERLAADGYVTGASARNWNGYGGGVTLCASRPATARALLSDPQTSGGLLVAAAPEAAQAVFDAFRHDGFIDARAIGVIVEGPAHIHVH